MSNYIIMKTALDSILTFVKKEWFLLTMVVTIALIVVLFELS